MKRAPVTGIIITILGFAAGSWIGYTMLPTHHAQEAEKSGVELEGNGIREGDGQRVPSSFRAGSREEKPRITRDGKGNYLLPAKLAERFRFMVLNDLSVNRDELRVVGLDDARMDGLQSVIDGMYARWLERTKSTMREFTRNGNEVVWKVTADRAANGADLAWMKEQMRGIVGTESPLLEERIVSAIGYVVLVQNGQDYFLRVSRSPSSPGMLAFESIVLTPRDGDALPQPGDAFAGFEDRYYYSSSQRSGGKPRPEMAPLLEGMDYQHLLEKPAGTPPR